MRKRSLFSRAQAPANPAADSQERRLLLGQLEATKRELDLAHLGFEQSRDPDLLEFYLFEIDALRARHSYLLRRIKALSPEAPPPPRAEPEAAQDP